MFSDKNILFPQIVSYYIHFLSAFFTQGRAEVHSRDWVGGLLRQIRGGQPQLRLTTPCNWTNRPSLTPRLVNNPG